MGEFDQYAALRDQIRALDSAVSTRFDGMEKDIREIREDVRSSKMSVGQYVANILISVLVAFVTVWFSSMGIHTPGVGKASNGNI